MTLEVSQKPILELKDSSLKKFEYVFESPVIFVTKVVHKLQLPFTISVLIVVLSTTV